MGAFTYYSTESPPPIQKIGFCELDNNPRLTNLYASTNLHYSNGIIETCRQFGLNDPIDLGEQLIGFDTIDSLLITQLCKENGLDGIVVGKMRFLQVTETMMFIPINQRTDVEVFLKLYGLNGNLLCHTSYDTYKANSYHINPKADRTTYDGVSSALSRILYAMKKEKVHYKRTEQPMLY
ncbi:MAG: hypothetical protein ACPGU4_07875 [Flavobacteriales bacterium]